MEDRQYSRPSARVIMDSTTPDGHRLTTMEVRMHRFVLAEFNTHRAFSRNAASSRAIPIHKRVKSVIEDPAMPVEWGINEKGMQASLVADPDTEREALDIWNKARGSMLSYAIQLDRLGIHKQLVNRLLEPWAWVTDVVSSTEWVNFFKQRCTRYSPLAQPEMRAAADEMIEAYQSSTPIKTGDSEYWHCPYIQPEEVGQMTMIDCIKVSVARCARVSYLTHGGKRDPAEDLTLYNRLVTAQPMHSSPLEHVASPCAGHWGNFTGWLQWRQVVERGMVPLGQDLLPVPVA